MSPYAGQAAGGDCDQRLDHVKTAARCGSEYGLEEGENAILAIGHVKDQEIQRHDCGGNIRNSAAGFRDEQHARGDTGTSERRPEIWLKHDQGEKDYRWRNGRQQGVAADRP